MLAFIDVQAGRRERFEEWLAKAESLTDQDAELAAVRGVCGLNLSDLAHYEDGVLRCTRWPDTYQWVNAYVLDAAL